MQRRAPTREALTGLERAPCPEQIRASGPGCPGSPTRHSVAFRSGSNRRCGRTAQRLQRTWNVLRSLHEPVTLTAADTDLAPWRIIVLEVTREMPHLAVASVRAAAIGQLADLNRGDRRVPRGRRPASRHRQDAGLSGHRVSPRRWGSASRPPRCRARRRARRAPHRRSIRGGDARHRASPAVASSAVRMACGWVRRAEGGASAVDHNTIRKECRPWRRFAAGPVLRARREGAGVRGRWQVRRDDGAPAAGRDQRGSRVLRRAPGPVRVAYEAGPTGFGLARALGVAEIECVVAAPEARRNGGSNRHPSCAYRLCLQFYGTRSHPLTASHREVR
jgi:hypothetical protein